MSISSCRVPRRHHEDGRFLFPSDRAADGKAVQPRQHDVEQDQRVVLFERMGEAVLAVRDMRHGKAGCLQIIALDFRDFRVVLYEEQLFHADVPFCSAASGWAHGSVMMVVSPPVGVCSARMLPCMAVMIAFAMASPSPLPSATLLRASSVR